MHKIAVIGDKDSILGFKSICLEFCAPEEDEETARILENLAADGYALIYITEDKANGIMDVISKYRSSYFPAIILIPGSKGSLGIGKRFVKESIEKAVGADILAHND